MMLFFLILSPLTYQKSHAFVLEPNLGYGFFTFLGTSPNATKPFSTSLTGNGFIVGLRAYLQPLIYGILGLEGAFSSNMRWRTPSLFYGSESAQTESGFDRRLGFIFGFKTPLLPFRFWAGLNFIDHMNIGSYGLKGGSGKLGFSFFLLHILAANFEIQRGVYSSDSAMTTLSQAEFLRSQPNGVVITSMLASLSLVCDIH